MVKKENDMKLTMKLLVLFFCVLMLGNVAYAQTPREQFQTTVAAFQKNATEDTARKLAELFKQLNPPPAVPEHAEFCALKGAAFVKQAGDATDYAKAAAEFQAAIALAPWVGDYHYNLAFCEKSAGHFSAAQTAIKFAQIFARDDKERHDCLALRAELEAAQELATAKKAEALAEQAEKNRKKILLRHRKSVNRMNLPLFFVKTKAPFLTVICRIRAGRR